jgi:hypothetical protein
MEHPMPQLNDLSRFLAALEQDTILIAAIEMGQSSWLPKLALFRTVSLYHVTGGRNYRLKLAGRRNSAKLTQIPTVILSVIAQN